MEEKELKDLLQWEVPQPTVWGGNVATPKMWIVRGSAVPFKLTMNRRWLEENAPEIAELVPRVAQGENKGGTKIVGVAIAIDRKEKVFRFLMNPAKDVPQWAAKLNGDKSGTLSISDKALGEDLWTMMEMPMEGYKKFLTAEVWREHKGKKIYKASYDPDLPENKAKITPPKPRNKKKD